MDSVALEVEGHMTVVRFWGSPERVSYRGGKGGYPPPNSNFPPFLHSGTSCRTELAILHTITGY